MQVHFHDGGDAHAQRLRVHHRDVAGDDPRLFHRGDAALHGGGRQVDLFRDAALGHAVVLLNQAQDRAVERIERFAGRFFAGRHHHAILLHWTP